ncbi:MAG: S46 family peptidase [Bacteroidales bacterium]|nr:S46 family peptidase [Bacteroidales bacterium]
MKKLILVWMLLSVVNFAAIADEGMWLLNKLNQLTLSEKGFQVSAEDIYSINHSSFKDGIVGLGSTTNPFRFFCSGEIISSEGLFLTNHHCGYGQIQAHSSPEHDYLTNGFWAMSKEEELVNPGLTVSILVEMRDVTAQVNAELNAEMTYADREKKIAELSKTIVSKIQEESGFGAIVKHMYEGNQFIAFIYQTFKDVRLVGAPPSSVGKFGGDTDNWMWPRHTGDFSMFRIYADKEGKPAEYSADNVPYKPAHHFPVSLKGYEKNDPAFVIGFPGSTDRYLTSYGIQENLDHVYPVRIECRGKKLEVMDKYMDQSDMVRIQYASKYARVSNYWKYFIGQSRGLKALNVYEKKKTFENELAAWINKDVKRKAIWGNAIQLIADSYAKKQSLAKTTQYYGEGLFGIEALTQPAGMVRNLIPLLEAEKADPEAIRKVTEQLKASAEAFYKDYNATLDQEMMWQILQLFTSNVPVEHQPELLIALNKKFKGDFKSYAAKFFASSIVVSKEKYLAFLDNPSLKALKKDPAVLLFQASIDKHTELQKGLGPINQDLNTGRRLFVAASLEFKKNQVTYPDANSTPRFTYGYVGDYSPADAVRYNYFTTINGILEKEDPTNDEFIVDAKLKQLVLAKDFGKYADKSGDLRVNFTTNNDITGGNSGSGVFNAKGELIGTAFDGNWESMSGDIAFEPELQKCINLDIRYTLWVIDKLAGAGHLVNEMTLIE